MIAQTVIEPANDFPLTIAILCYTAVLLLMAILLLLFRISSQITEASKRLKQPSRPSSPTSPSPSANPAEPAAPAIEVGPGTPFEEFLNEDPDNRRLSKKEQFKAYRKWRAEKGLNWSK